MAVFVAAVGLAVYVIVTKARAAGLLAPVLIGGALRLAVMVVAHAGSISLNDGGLMFVDDVTYAQHGSALADLWRSGDFANPSNFDLTGSYQFGYPVLVGLVFTLVGESVFVAKLVNVLFGTATVLIIGLIAREVLGQGAHRRAAWLVALAPGVVWWSAPLLKEAFVTFLTAAAVLAALKLPRAAGYLAALLVALALTRISLVVVLVVSLIVGLLLAARKADRVIRWRSAMLVALSASVAVAAFLVLASGGRPVGFIDAYRSTIDQMIEIYQGSNLAAVPADALKSLVTPIPWAFDEATRNWDRGLYPGMWFWYLAYPLAALGLWRLRRRPELALIALPIVLSLVLGALTSGFLFRQRAPIEPLILLLVCQGITSWRQALQLASLALPVVGIAAAVQSGSVALGLGIAACGLVLFALARRAPALDLRQPLPPSPLVAAVEASWKPLVHLRAAAWLRRRRGGQP